MNEIARILKPGGISFISVPAIYSFETDSDGNVVRSGISSNPHHLYEPTEEEVRDYITNAGLEVIKDCGQIVAKKSNAELVLKLSKYFPAWAFYIYNLSDEAYQIREKPVEEGKVPLGHFMVAQKPSKKGE